MAEIGVLVTEGFQMMTLATASVFEFAAAETAPEPAYRIRFVSMQGGPVPGSLGARLDTHRLEPASLDTLLVTGPVGVPPSIPGLTEAIQESTRYCRRVAAVCTGAFFLAEAGVLDGRKATTHWALAPILHARFPAIRVEPDRIFIADGSIWTSAGLSAGLDLALGLVEDDLGPAIARRVARTLVLHHRRGGGQSQHSVLLEMDARSDRIQLALNHARANLTAPLTVQELAAAAHLSPRQFSRIFRAETGQTPARAVEALRLEAARRMVEQSRHPIDVIARDSGFTDPERMRRAFLRAFGQPPQAMRRMARAG